jgi:hypothetical protein
MEIFRDWYDGTRWDLTIPDDWVVVSGTQRFTFQSESTGNKFSFGVRKALPETREEQTIDACRTIALGDALSLPFWPGRLGALALQSTWNTLLRVPSAKLRLVNLWLRAKKAQIIPVNAGVLTGHALQTIENNGVRCRGYARYDNWRIYLETRSRNATEALTTIHLLCAMQFRAVNPAKDVQ